MKTNVITMKSEEKTATLWLTCFSKSKRTDNKQVDIDPNQAIENIVKSFEKGRHEIESELCGSFGADPVKADFVFDDPSDDPLDEGSKYIKFPLFRIDLNRKSCLEKYHLSNLENKKEIAEYLSLISYIRIVINPCFYQNYKKKTNTHKTKIYIMLCHAGDLATDRMPIFFNFAGMIADVIAKVIKQKYSIFIEHSGLPLKEEDIKSKIITGTFYNNEVEQLHKELYHDLIDKKILDKRKVNNLWKPFIEYGKNILSDDFLNKIEAFHHRTRKREKTIDGIFGITGGHDKEENNLTYIFGVSPYPRDAAIGVHKPIIAQQ